MTDANKPHLFVTEIGKSACVVCGAHASARIHHDLRRSDDPLPDSGLRKSYGDGMAVREADPSKPLMECISPALEVALGTLMAKAEFKYIEAGGCRNWEKGMPVMRCVGGIKRHVNRFVLGDETEDHLAAIAWNAMVLIHYRDLGTTTGKSFAELDDRPKWFKAPK